MGVQRAFIALSAGQLVALVSAYSTHVVLARVLGASDYGDYGIILNALTTASVVLTAGLPEAIAKAVAQRPEIARGVAYQALRLQATVVLLVGVGYALVSPLLARVLKDPEIAASLALSALSMPGVAMGSVAQGTFNGQHRFWSQSLLIAGGALARCVAVVPLAYYYRVPGAVAGLVLAPTVVGLAALPALRPHAGPGLADPKELSRFARPVVVFTMALVLLMNLDLFVVKGAGTSAERIGLYAAAATVAKIPYLVLSALGVVLLPVLSSTASAKEAARATLRTAFRGLLLGSFLIAGTLVPLSSAILRTLYGSAFVEAALPLAVLLVSGTLFTLFFVISYALYGINDPKTPMKLTLAGLAFEATLLVPAIRMFGVVGAAAASALTSTLMFSAALVAARGAFGAIVAKATLLRASFACVLTVALGLALTNGSFLSLLLSPVLALVNVGLLLVTRETSLTELTALLRRSPVSRGPVEAES